MSSAAYEAEVVVVGAGLAGLTCALELYRQGVQNVLLVEASDGVGGRVRTDEVEGFRLDRGFQVLLTAYPTARRYLSYEALDLRAFYPGALIRTGGAFEKMSDPFRRPVEGLKTILSPVGSAGDKLRIGQLRAKMLIESLESIYSAPGKRSIDWLREEGYSEAFITQFFRPFYGGVMLDQGLETSSKMLAFTYKMFAAGDTSIPALGMGQLTAQLAAQLDPERILLNTPVKRLVEGGVELEDGRVVRAQRVVIATEQDFAVEALGGEVEHRGWRGVANVYFAAPQAPIEEPILVLNGEGVGAVNNVCVLSQVSPHVAPAGQALISVSVLGPLASAPQEELERVVREELGEWFGEQVVASWRHLRTYWIARGQPDQSGDKLDEVSREVRVRDGVYVCGDHRETASIEGAMRSGVRAAQALLRDRGAASSAA